MAHATKLIDELALDGIVPVDEAEEINTVFEMRPRILELKPCETKTPATF